SVSTGAALYPHSFCLHPAHFSQFTVTGPDHPITTSVGGEAVLPCHLSPRMSAENMEVRWFRFQYHSVVHLYQEGQDKYEEQMLEYRGRTELLKDGITNGSVSLRIYQVQLSDHGQYTCFFQYGIFYEEAILELMVSAIGSDPHISVDGHQDGGIRIVCQSAGWHPEPEAQWRDHHGQLLSSASEKISKETNGLFRTQISIVITEDSNQNLSCFVRNPLINQEKISTVFIAGQCPSTLHWEWCDPTLIGHAEWGATIFKRAPPCPHQVPFLKARRGRAACPIRYQTKPHVVLSQCRIGDKGLKQRTNRFNTR
uniref:Ig-like domain-containing protein n=1 Tax=Chelydra serpentina TaxID=8475 RepID=A0A8C3SHK9_CHESE